MLPEPVFAQLLGLSSKAKGKHMTVLASSHFLLLNVHSCQRFSIPNHSILCQYFVTPIMYGLIVLAALFASTYARPAGTVRWRNVSSTPPSNETPLHSPYEFVLPVHTPARQE